MKKQEDRGGGVEEKKKKEEESWDPIPVRGERSASGRAFACLLLFGIATCTTHGLVQRCECGP